MTCADARHQILTADLDVLRGESDAELREHMAGCAECARQASRVIASTTTLRQALISRGSRSAVAPRRRGRRVAVTLIPIALAAEIAFLAFVYRRDNAPMIQRPVIDDSVTTIHQVMTPVPAPVVTVSAAAAHVVAPRKVAALPADDTSVIEPKASGPSDSLPSQADQLQVIPGKHQRVAVIGTSNPRITVIWLSKVDSI